MSTETTTPPSPRPQRLGIYTAAAAVGATAAVFLGVLPAEYGLDPTGFGRATGLIRLSEPAAPVEQVVETQMDAPVEIATLNETPFRTDTVTLTVPSMMENFGQVEYKISMREGDAMVYSWTSSAPLYYEFHGHTVEEGGDPIQVMNYITDESTSAQGKLIAPLDGIHGWYFRHDGFEPIEVEFTFAGFYELEPGVMGLEPAE